MELGQADYPFQQAGSGVLVNAIDGMRVVKVYDLVDRLKGRLDHILSSRMKLSVDQLLCQQLPKIVFEFVGIFIVVILIALAQMFPSLGLDFPALAAFVVALRQITPTASTLNVNYLNMNQQWAQAKVIEETLTHMPQEDENRGSVLLPDAIQTLRLESVSFAYEKNPHLQVLHDLSISFTRGKVTALVGATGAGKTTIVDLFLRLQEPNRGRLLANDTDIRQFSLAEWRQRIGYVGQEVFLFNATLAENIAALDDRVPMAEIVKAAQVTQIHDFIMTLPAGYQTNVGDRGVKLSGGQRQRIAVARAILKHPKILILDEATSALDNLTERALHEAIAYIRHEAIVIVIAHRLSTVEDADEIVVLEGGRVVERGSHDVLLARQGLYRQLYTATPDPVPAVDAPVPAPKDRG
jgi:ABC-type multidrug transport system fused ATPase/permease subunit